MRVRGHLRLLALATAVWLAFFVAGLPGYYQQYSTRSLLVFEALLLPPIWAAGFLALRGRRRNRTRHALLLSFYFTVPLFLYDLLYCGLLLGHGLGFVVPYWYLTAYYAVPWVLFPATAAWLERRARTETAAQGPPQG